MAASAQQAPPWRAVFAGTRGRLTIGLLLLEALVAVEIMVVATILPAVEADLHGLKLYGWIYAALTLASIGSVPIAGRMTDRLGPRPILAISIVFYVGGLVLAATAPTMFILVLARFVQGIGGGGIGTVAMAVVADIVPARQIGRWLGYQGMGFAVASVIGPVVGGLFVDHLSWRWAFYINVPFGVLGIALIASQLRIPYRRLPHALDWLGSLLLMIALACFVIVATLGGTEFSWRSGRAVGLVVAVLVVGAAFVWRERRASEPVLPLRLFDDAVIRVSTIVNLASGLVFYCGIFFVPLFMQEVHGVSPTSSGLVLTPLMFGAAFGTMISGRQVERSGRIRSWPIAGSALMAGGVGLLITLREHTPVPSAAFYVLVLGIGIGFVMQPSLLAAQNAARPADLGTTTSTALLFRMMGSTIGVPIFGGILNAGLPAGRHTAADFTHALPPVFVAALPVTLLSILAATRLPERPLRDTTHITEVLV